MTCPGFTDGVLLTGSYWLRKIGPVSWFTTVLLYPWYKPSVEEEPATAEVETAEPTVDSKTEIYWVILFVFFGSTLKLRRAKVEPRGVPDIILLCCIYRDKLLLPFPIKR